MSIDPHADAPEENPEEHIGDEIPDPWEDDSATDWPNDSRNLAELAEDEEVSG
jgi:hypothetical protein